MVVTVTTSLPSQVWKQSGSQQFLSHPRNGAVALSLTFVVGIGMSSSSSLGIEIQSVCCERIWSACLLTTLPSASLILYNCTPLGLVIVSGKHLVSLHLLKSWISTRSSCWKVRNYILLSYFMVFFSCCCSTLSLMLGITKSKCDRGLCFNNSAGATPVVIWGVSL